MKDGTREFDVHAALAAIDDGWPVQFEGIDVVSARILGRMFNLASDRPRDPIQRKHRRGMFYEKAELEQIKAHLPLRGIFVDIGANIGNHSLFVAGFMSPRKIIPFEPNPAACKLLLANITMNGFTDLFDLTHLGLGLADQAGDGFGVKGTARNLGAGRLDAGEGDIRTIRGDDALAAYDVDMIKIDVEGMEMDVLRGLSATLRRSRPMIMIEVDERNYDAFDIWMRDQGFEVVEKVQRYDNNINYLLAPVADTGKGAAA